MTFLYTIFISFIIIFLAELGDKTQLLVLSFVSKSKVKNIVLGIVLGSLFSHGIAIAFGSSLANYYNTSIIDFLKTITYFAFLTIGILGFFPNHFNIIHKNMLLQKISNSSLNYVFIIALCIIIGEIGDKTFLSSIGLGIEYSNYKFSLICGAVFGMVISNLIAIEFGKFIESHFSQKSINTLSNIIFIVFGLLGLLLN